MPTEEVHVLPGALPGLPPGLRTNMKRQFVLRNIVVHILAFIWLAVFVVRYTDMFGTWRGFWFFLLSSIVCGFLFPIITYKPKKGETTKP